MPLDTLLKRVDGLLQAEQAFEQLKPGDQAQTSLEAERRDALRQLQAEYNASRAAMAGGGAFSRLLVAVDGSEPAGRAVDAAVRLAGEVGGKVALVHVTPMEVAFSPEFEFAETSLLVTRRRESAQLLQRAEGKVPPSLRAGVIQKEGNAMHEIIAAAKEFKADLIVVGTHGRGAVAHLLLGSTAEAVVRHAHCPVLVIGREPVEKAKQCGCASGKCCEASKVRQESARPARQLDAPAAVS